MKQGALAVIQFLAGFFQVDKPESFARGITVVIVAAVIGWDTSYVRWTHTLPDVLTMGAQGVFMTLFYFGGKSISAYADGKKPDQPPQP